VLDSKAVAFAKALDAHDDQAGAERSLRLNVTAA
jgi:hypothetical protein